MIYSTRYLGGRIHIRLDILLAILVPDMLTLVDEYSNAFFSQSTTSQMSLSTESSLCETQRLKPIHERWRENRCRRDRGYYSKPPAEPIMNNLVSSLLAGRPDVNVNIKLPTVAPDWLNIAIRLLLSVGNGSDHPHFVLRTDHDCPLLDTVLTFIEKWFTSTINESQRSRPVSIQFSLPSEQLQDLSERSIFILERILVPLLPCQLVINKVYCCKQCKSTMKIVSSINSISINVVRSGLHLEHELHSFFSPTISDIPCASCGKPYVRHVQVIQWPPVLIINVNDAHRNVKFRHPPNVISLVQFSSWLAISCPSSSVFHLTCFNSILRSGGHETMVQATKIKKSWSTTINRRLIGDGEQLRRLFANSSKFL